MDAASLLPHIRVGTEIIGVMPSEEHEYLLPTSAVAFGYGVSEDAIRAHKQRQADELMEGRHWLSVTNCHAGNGNLPKTLWTKRGIVRLGFFIRSERAKLFRDAAEDLVIFSGTKQTLQAADARITELEESFNRLLNTCSDLFERANHITQDVPALQDAVSDLRARVTDCETKLEPPVLPADQHQPITSPVSKHYEKSTSCGFSMRPSDRARAKQRAIDLGMTWSGYLRHCIDLESSRKTPGTLREYSSPQAHS